MSADDDDDECVIRVNNLLIPLFLPSFPIFVNYWSVLSPLLSYFFILFPIHFVLICLFLSIPTICILSIVSGPSLFLFLFSLYSRVLPSLRFHPSI